MIGAGSVIVSADSDLIQYLEDKGNRNVDLWKYLSDQDIEQNWHNTVDIAGRWWRNTPLDRFTFLGLPICPTISFVMYFSFRAALNSQTAVTKWMDSIGQNDVIHICGNHRQYLSGMAMSVNETDILDSIVRWNSEKKELMIVTYVLPQNLYYSKRKKKKGNPIIRSSFQNSILPLEEWNKIKILFLINYKPSEGEDILLRNIPSALREKVLTAHYFIDEVKIPFEESYRVVLDDFNLYSESDREILHKAEEAIIQFFKNKNFENEYGCLFGNPYFEFQISYFTHRFQLGLDYLIKFEKLLNMVKPEIIVFGNSYSSETRLLIAFARTKKIRTMTFIHGGITNLAGYKYRVLEVDDYLVSGESIKQGLISSGQKKDSICTIGNPKLTNIESYKTNGANLKSGKKTITFITGKGGELTLAMMNGRINRFCLDEIAELIGRRKDIQFNFKIHPHGYDFKYLYERLDAKTGDNLKILSGGDIFTIISESDILISVNYVSNIILETLLLGKPTILYSPAIFKIPANSSIYDEMFDWMAGSTKELEEKIDWLINMPEEEKTQITQNRLDKLVVDKNRNPQEKFWRLVLDNLHEQKINEDPKEKDEKIPAVILKSLNYLHEYLQGKQRERKKEIYNYLLKNDAFFVNRSINNFMRRYLLTPSGFFRAVRLKFRLGYGKESIFFLANRIRKNLSGRNV